MRNVLISLAISLVTISLLSWLLIDGRHKEGHHDEETPLLPPAMVCILLGHDAGFEVVVHARAGLEDSWSFLDARLSEQLGEQGARFVEVIAVNRGDSERALDVSALDIVLADGTTLHGRPLSAAPSKGATVRHLMAAYGPGRGPLPGGRLRREWAAFSEKPDLVGSRGGSLGSVALELKEVDAERLARFLESPEGSLVDWLTEEPAR